MALCGSSEEEIKADEVGRVSGFQANLASLAGRRGGKGGHGVSGRVLQIKSNALMYPAPHHHPPSRPPICLLFSAPPFLIRSIFTRGTGREKKLAALRSGRGGRVSCSRKRGPEGSQMARDERNGRDVELRGRGMRGRRDGVEARRRARRGRSDLDQGSLIGREKRRTTQLKRRPG